MSTSMARRGLPLWARFALALGIGALLLAGLIVFVESNNGNGEATQNRQAIVRANEQAEVLVAQDQAPHVVRLRTGGAPRAAMARAVRTRMSSLVAGGTVPGPLKSVRCARTGGTRRSPAFRCTAVAAGVIYPFLGVVDVAGGTVTYCKRDEPPVPSQDVPVSPRCLARATSAPSAPSATG